MDYLILEAAAWGLIAGSALLLGSSIGYLLPIPQKIIGLIMAFGSGVLFSTLAFELINNSFVKGGFLAVVPGFLLGGLVYSLINSFISHLSGTDRTRLTAAQTPKNENRNNGLTIAAGALLDGIPESVAIGITLTKGSSVGLVAVIAVFLSNIPEGLSSAAGMRKSGRSLIFVMVIWASIALLSGIASLAGYLFFNNVSDIITASVLSFAAGAILAMLANTMMPEAYESTHDLTGVVTVLGFLVAFILSKTL